MGVNHLLIHIIQCFQPCCCVWFLVTFLTKLMRMEYRRNQSKEWHTQLVECLHDRCMDRSPKIRVLAVECLGMLQREQRLNKVEKKLLELLEVRIVCDAITLERLNW